MERGAVASCSLCNPVNKLRFSLLTGSSLMHHKKGPDALELIRRSTNKTATS